jgi:serine/threonine protein phosphatase PrpC
MDNSGALAGKEALDRAQSELWPSKLPPDATINQTVTAIKSAFVAAAEGLRHVQSVPGYENVSATLNISKIAYSTDGGRRFLVSGHLGDSRTYVYSRSRRDLRKVTSDHTLVQRLVDIGQISQAEAFLHPERKSVYRHLGTIDPNEAESLERVSISIEELAPDDVVLQLSNGVHNNLTEAEIKQLMIEGVASGSGNIYTGIAERICETAQTISRSKALPQARPDDMAVIIMAEKTPLKRPEIKDRAWTVGSKVRVRRNTDGTIEDDWIIGSIDQDSIGVFKQMPDGSHQTKIFRGPERDLLFGIN